MDEVNELLREAIAQCNAVMAGMKQIRAADRQIATVIEGISKNVDEVARLLHLPDNDDNKESGSE